MQDDGFGAFPPVSRRVALRGVAATTLQVLLAPRVWAATHAPLAGGTDESAAEHGFANLSLDMVRTGQSDGVAVVVVRNRVASYCTAGLGTRGAGAAVTPDSVFEIGSISKVLSAHVLAHAVVTGRVDLRADIRTYLPQGYANLSFAGQPIRVQHLVDTTSALPDNLPDTGTLLEGHSPATHLTVIAEHVAGATAEALLAELRTARIVRPPGQRPAHSNVAAQLLGIMLSRVFQTPYVSLLNRFVEQPFGMTPTARTRSPMNTTGYADGTSPAVPYLEGEIMQAAGSLAYSARDMGRLLTGLLSSRDSATLLARRVLQGNVSEEGLAFAWRVTTAPDGRLRFRASGGTLGYSSYIELYPELGYGVALLANRAGEAQDHLKWMAERGKDRILGKPAALQAFEQALVANGFTRVAAAAAAVQRRYPTFHLSQDLINTWAFGLIFDGRKADGMALLEFKATAAPRSADALLSFAEGTLAIGERAAAVGRFRRVLVVDPDNEQARSRIDELERAP